MVPGGSRLMVFTVVVFSFLIFSLGTYRRRTTVYIVHEFCDFRLYFMGPAPTSRSQHPAELAKGPHQSGPETKPTEAPTHSCASHNTRPCTHGLH